MNKIALVNSFYPPTIIGGAEISTSLLAEGLSKKYDVSVITSGEHRFGIKREVLNNVKIYRLPNTNIFWPANKKERKKLIKLAWHVLNIYNPIQNFYLNKVIKEIQPDIINTQNLVGVGTYLWEISKKNKIKVVHTLRDYGLYNLVDQSNFNNLVQYFNKRRSSNVDEVVGISRYILNNHIDRRFFPLADNTVISNIVTSETFRKKTREAKSPLVIGYFGMLENNKGVDFFVKSITKIPEHIVGKVLICGEGSEKEKLLSIIGEDSRFVFLGKITHEMTQQKMAEVDLTIVPSRWQEPFGRVIIESYCQGTPVLGSAVGGIPEIIKNDSYLFERDDENDLIKKIIKVYEQSPEEGLINSKLLKKEANKYRDNTEEYIAVYKN